MLRKMPEPNQYVKTQLSAAFLCIVETGWEIGYIASMKMSVIYLLGLSLAGLFIAGCASTPPGVERGPHGTIAYYVSVEASPPGARIEANGEDIGTTPLTLKIFGDKDGTFHDFGSYYYVVRALPLTTNQFPQARYFRTGRWFTPEDMVPRQIYFDMNRPSPAFMPPQMGPPPPYAAPPWYYGPPVYYGPGVRFYWGPRWRY